MEKDQDRVEADRLRLLAEQIAEHVRVEGGMSAGISDPDTRAFWRRAARLAGRLLDQRIETAEYKDWVTVVVRERTPEQEEVMSRRIRESLSRSWARGKAATAARKDHGLVGVGEVVDLTEELRARKTPVD